MSRTRRSRRSRARAALLAAGLAGLASGCFDGASSRANAPAVSAPPAPEREVGAIGRLEPEDGVYRLAGPSGGSSVIAELRVDYGSEVKRGQVIAVLDTAPMLKADVARLSAELDNARNELARHHELNTSKVISDSLREDRETRVRVVEARLAHARAELERAHVRSPIDGRVLYVHAREGERIPEAGVVEVGRTDHMFAIAEVYEDDIGHVHVGQRARVTSPVLASALTGSVERIRQRVAKQDALGTDPAARKDARVIEVEVRLDDSQPAAGLTNLQVEIHIET
ncbi:MAG TPA: efflux RND transporter periplasmic adaptor subunit [Myxococcota bacterium]|nr:efflux RND transporter periplasmic adaptor subunit [Myxococcota bacterium]